MIATLTLTTLLLSAPLGDDVAAPRAITGPSATVPDAASGLAVVPARIDLGTVARGATVRASTWLVNTSLAPVTVTKAKPGCGCTTVHFEPVTLAPGAAERVWFDLKAPAKSRAKTVKLDFQPEWGRRVTLEATVATADDAPAPAAPDDTAGVLLVPETADLGPITVGAPVETSAWLINAGDSIARVNGFKAGCGCTTVVGFAPTDLAPAAAQRVRLRVTPTAKATSAPVKIVKLKAMVDGNAEPITASLTMTVRDQVVDLTRE